MNGLVNSIFPVFSFLDSGLAELGIDTWLRICVLGLLSGLIAMLLYRLVSNQDRIKAHKRTIADIRVQLGNVVDEDFAEVMKLSRKNVRASLALLSSVIFPTLISTVPVLLSLLWVQQQYTHDFSKDVDSLDVIIVPSHVAVSFTDTDRIIRIAEGHYSIPAGGNAKRVILTEIGKGLSIELPIDPPTASFDQKPWWHWLMADEAGYLPVGSDIAVIETDYPRLILHQSAPAWMSTWEFTFFFCVLLASLTLKFGLKIE